MKVYHLLLAASLFPATVIAADTGNAASTQPASPATTTPATSGETAASTSSGKHDVADQSGFSKGSVVRSTFTNAVKEREPTDQVNTTNSELIFYFTELRDMKGQTATHRWEYSGKVVAEVKFNVGGNRWRVWSSKAFLPALAGEYKVSVLNGAGEVIKEEMLQVSASAGQKESAAPAATPAAQGNTPPAQ